MWVYLLPWLIPLGLFIIEALVVLIFTGKLPEEDPNSCFNCGHYHPPSDDCSDYIDHY